MNKLLLAICSIVCLVPAVQAQNVESQIVASQYGAWQVAGYAPSTYTFAPTSCRVQGGASFFNAFSVGVPVRIVDGNPALSETVTPSAVTINNNVCSITISPANQHNLPFYLTSATGGLQEAINATHTEPAVNTVILDSTFYSLVGSASVQGIIASVSGYTQLGLVDVTQTPYVWYGWNGSHYVAISLSSITFGSGAPSNPCPATGAQYYDTVGKVLYVCPTSGGDWSIAGGSGSGNVNPAAQYAKATYPNSGSSAVVGGAAQSYLLAPGLTSAQISAILNDDLPGSYEIQNGDAPTPFSNPHDVKIQDDRTDVSPTPRSGKEFGMQCDLRENISGSLTATLASGSNIMTLDAGALSAADVGKTVVAVGAVSGIPTAFEPTITAVSNSTTATLSTNSPFSTASLGIEIGHDDSAGLAQAIDFSVSSTGFRLTIPNGLCLTHTQNIWPSWMEGMGKGSIDDVGFSALVGFPGEDVFSATTVNYTNMDFGNLNIGVDTDIDPTQPWQIVDASGDTESETPVYRPLAAQTAYSNNPLGPGWLAGSGANGSGSIVGVGTVSNDSTSMTVLSASVPVVGEQVLFPFSSTGLFSTTVSAVSGSTVTLGAAFPGAATTQEEFFAGASAQNIQTEITSGQTMPFTVTLANSIAPTPVGESNVAPYGMVEIGDEEFKYIGYSKASPYTITLTARAQNGTTAADHAVDSIIVRLNPFEPDYPWPVTPTINSDATTPANASFYPGFNVGNCGLCTPIANGSEGGSGPYQAYIHDLVIGTWYPSGTEDDPDAAIYFVSPPYSTRFQNLDLSGNFGFVEGLPSVNNHPYIGAASGNANSYQGISAHTGAAGMAVAINWGGQNSYKDLNLYTNGGAGLNLLNAYDDQTGANAGGEAGALFINILHEPGAANYPGTGSEPRTSWGPVGEWDCAGCTWTGIGLGGTGELFIGGSYQKFLGAGFDASEGSTQPVINYSSNSTFDQVNSITSTAVGNMYGANSFLNWGAETTASGSVGSGLPFLQVSYGCGRQPTLGQTNETFNTGNLTAPYTNSTSGLICPDEFNQNPSQESQPFGAWTFDATSPISQGYVPCAVTTASGTQCGTYNFTSGPIYVGPGQRLVAGKYIATVSLKGSLSSNTVHVGVGAPGVSGASVSVPVTSSWSTYSFPVDFTGASSGAILAFSLDQATLADTIDLGYVDFAPAIQQLNLYPSTSGGSSTGCYSSPVEGIANSGYVCPPPGWGNNLASSQGSADTTATLSSSPAAYQSAGCFYLDAEIECYTGISGDELTGLTRGAYGTTAADHADTDNVLSLNVALSSPLEQPGLVYGGPVGSGVAVVGINNPTPSNHSGGTSLDINSGSAETDVWKNGAITQASTTIENNLGSLVLGGEVQYFGNYYQPLTGSNEVLKSNGQNNTTVPMSFSGGLAGPLNITAPATIVAPVPILQGPGGTTTYTYECTGVDTTGNTIAGTPASITDGPASLSSSDYILVSCPFQAGPASYTIWRTAGGPNQGYIASGVGQGGSFIDVGGAATPGTAPGTTSAPKVCLGSSCWHTGSTAPSGSCATGDLYTNQSGSPDTLYVCKAGAWAGVL